MKNKPFHLKDHKRRIVDFHFASRVKYEKWCFLLLFEYDTNSTFRTDEYEMEDIANPYHSIQHFRAKDAKFHLQEGDEYHLQH